MAAKINSAVYATPYPRSPSIWIAYPGIGDWQQVFLPVLDPVRAKDLRWLRAKYEVLKTAHENFVGDQLELIARQSTGQTIFRLFRDKPGYSVMIFPFEFSDSYDESLNASTYAVQEYAATVKGEYIMYNRQSICDHEPDGTLICRGTGTGSAADIFFLNQATIVPAKESPDEILLHELVHALRDVSGVSFRSAVGGGYENEEEFYAVLVTNMYRSNKNRPLFGYDTAQIDGNNFLDTDMSPNPRELIRRLRSAHPRLFQALMDVKAPFNPVKRFFDEL